MDVFMGATIGISFGMAIGKAAPGVRWECDIAGR